MALENEELQQMMAEVVAAMQGLAQATGAEADETVKLTAEQKKLKAKIDATTKAFGAIGGFAKTVGEGNTEFKAMNGVIDTVTGALAGMAKVLPVFGDAVGAAIKGVGESAKFVIEQLDQTYKAFEQFGDVGALGAKGMSGLNDQFIRSGMSLQGFTKAVTANSTTLAKFAGTAYDGAERFSKVVGDIATTSAGDELRRLGIGADKIGETAASFLQRETRLGRTQTMTQAQLTEGTIKYAKELDELSKLTGQSKDALQKQQDAALSEARFRSEIEDLRMRGEDAAADALLQFQSIAHNMDKDFAQGVRDLATGNATSDAAKSLLAATGGAGMDVMDQLKAGIIGPVDAAKQFQGILRENKQSMVDYGKAVGNGEQVFGNLPGLYDAMNAEIAANGQVSKKTQKEQTEGADELTNQTVDAKKALELMSRNISKLGMTLLPAAASAVEGFTTALNKFVTYVGDKLGIKMPGSTAGSASAGSAGGGGGGDISVADMMNSGGEAQLTPQESAAYAAKQGASGSLAGLRIKSPEAYSGGETSGRLIEVANMIQDKIGGDLKHFSAFNDSYHRGPNSLHGQGKALDFTIADPSRSADIAGMVKGIPGVSKVIDEYINPSGHATAGHIHAEISARNGFNGMLSGPTSGYKPNLTMHGTESISIRPTMSGDTTSSTSDIGIMSRQLEQLEELVSVMKSQVSLTSRIVQLQS